LALHRDGREPHGCLEIGSELECKRRRGYCYFGRCVLPARQIGRCTGQTVCCRG
uniref:Beta-defensin-like domain-containing protein n=1 Tax=Cyanistes caeruleus TaxID=156563 RepID=A0A8C0VHW2_CYACU